MHLSRVNLYLGNVEKTKYQIKQKSELDVFENLTSIKIFKHPENASVLEFYLTS